MVHIGRHRIRRQKPIYEAMPSKNVDIQFIRSSLLQRSTFITSTLVASLVLSSSLMNNGTYLFSSNAVARNIMKHYDGNEAEMSGSSTGPVQGKIFL